MKTDTSGLPGRLPRVLLCLQLLGAMVDFGALGLTSTSGFDAGKWLFLSPGLALGMYLLVASPILMRWLLAGPMFFIVGWFAWSLIGVLWSVDTQATFLQMILALTTIVSSYWFTRSFGRTSFARVFCVSAGIVLAIGLANDLVPAIEAILPIEKSQTEFGLETGRSPGLTPGVNQLGMLAGVTAIMGLRLRPQSDLQRVARIGVLGLAGLAMVTAGSRSVAVCTIAALAVQTGLHASTSTRIRGAVGALAGLLVTVGVIGATGAETTFQSGRSFDSLNGRSAVWAHALDLIGEHPLRGVGMMTGQFNWTRAFASGRTSFNAGDAHNMVLEILIGTGTIGLALFMAGAFWAAVRAWRQRDEDALALLLLVGFVGLTEALVSAAGLIYAILGLVLALVATDPIVRPWPTGRGGNPGALLGESSVFEPVRTLA